MTRLLTLGPLVVAVCAATAAPAAAQMSRRSFQPITQVASASQGELHGVVLDDRGEPLRGAVLSALGSTTAFAVSDGEGRFLFRNLPPGPYLVRAHLQGYVPARGRIIQIGAGRTSSTISLTRRDQGDDPQVLAAGVGTGGADGTAAEESEKHDHGEVAWRLRHLKRSVLKEQDSGLVGLDEAGSVFEGPLATFGRAVGTPARYATALFTELPFTGQINLLTSTSFDRPQDLFTAEGLIPHGVAYLSLAAPASGGDWSMRGAMTQGDLASWILSGAYVRRADAEHRYEAGLSYGMQRYLGGNADALAATTDGSRNVGAVYAYDNWTLNPHLGIGYGAKYARYDYLADRALISPRLSVTVKPDAEDSLELRATVSRREIAPGAEEFLPPSTGLWLPPERTFSPLSARTGFVPERIQHLEVAAERQWMGDFVVGLRAFRQRVDDQLVTMFGVALPGNAPATLGHYYVASGGDLDAVGWGVSFSRDMIDGVRASIDYTQTETDWVGLSPDASVLALVATSAVRREAERVYDLTTSVETVVPVTATRVFVLYKMNTAFAASDGEAAAGPGTRFDVQVTQALPFMNFTNAHWEMLVAVRNLFRDDLLDASVYDELLVVRPPKRVVGGVTVRF
jgi:hypothetical protein